MIFEKGLFSRYLAWAAMLLMGMVLAISPAAATSYTVTAGSNYFANHSFSTYTTANNTAAVAGQVQQDLGQHLRFLMLGPGARVRGR